MMCVVWWEGGGAGGVAPGRGAGGGGGGGGRGGGKETFARKTFYLVYSASTTKCRWKAIPIWKGNVTSLRKSRFADDAERMFAGDTANV